MADQSFHVIYDGVALETGRMDVRHLAPSLLALGEVYQEIQRIIYPDEPALALEVKATSEGSFDVHLILTQSLWQQAVSMFSGDAATALANIFGIGSGVMGLLVALRTRRVRKREQIDSGAVRITFDDNTVIEVPADVLRASESLTVRKALREVVEPLRQDGIELFKITSDTKIDIARISKEDVSAFDLPPVVDEPLTDSTREEVLSLSSVAFADGNKWKLTDGERTFFAGINDQTFLRRVAADEVRFAKHDLLRVELRVTQWRTEAGLRSDYSVERVIDHIPAARPIPLPFED